MKTTVSMLALVAAFGVSIPAFADVTHGKGSTIGMPGKKTEASRTVTIVMKDNSFSIENIPVKAGETIRFVVRNEGELLHEFNIGTPDMHATHQQQMMKMVELGALTPTSLNLNMSSHVAMGHSSADMAGMKHDDPNSVLVEPGKSAELVWKFSTPGTIEFACNVPAHYQTGMMGKFNFAN